MGVPAIHGAANSGSFQQAREWLDRAALAEAEGRPADAESALEAGLAGNPGSLPLLRRATSLAAAAGRLGDAQILLHRLLVADPDDAEAWELAAQLARMCGDLPGRHEAFGELVRLRPHDTKALWNFLQSARDAGRLDEAAERIARWREAAPADPVLLFGEGVAAEGRADFAHAMDAYDGVLALPGGEGLNDAIVRWAIVMGRHTERPETEAAIGRAIAVAPNEPDLFQVKAAWLIGKSRPAEALEAALEARRLLTNPNFNVEVNIVNASLSVGLQDDALAAARRALEIGPNEVAAHRSLLGSLPYHPSVTGRGLREAAEAAATCYPAEDGHRFANPPDPARRLTVAAMSGRFCGHPVGWLTILGFEHLDPAQFRTIGYDTGLKKPDHVTQRFRAAFTEWRDMGKSSERELIERMREDGCDIVIDLSGWGAGGRMHALGMRAAPVQMKWVGSQAHSTGMATMDWFVTDRWETPEGYEPLYTERLLRLDDGYVAYAPAVHAAPVGPPPCLGNGHVTFGCYNNLAKVTSQVLATWARILRELPGSRLKLRTHAFGAESVRTRIQAAFADAGVDPARVDLLGPLPHDKFLASYGEIDIALDPFPYGGGLSTLEAMWMGVPTVALAGETFAGRHSVSHLSNAGLADWVAADIDSYVALALERARDTDGLARLRAGLREQMRSSPVCDGPRFGRSLGRGLRHAWRAWCEEQQAEPDPASAAAWRRPAASEPTAAPSSPATRLADPVASLFEGAVPVDTLRRIRGRLAVGPGLFPLRPPGRAEASALEGHPIFDALRAEAVTPYSMEPDAIALLLRVVETIRPRIVVELGAGLSTAILADRLEPGARYLSIEQDPSWAALVRSWLVRAGVEHRATVLEAPSVPVEALGTRTRFYDLEMSGLRERLDGALIDLLIVDGPAAGGPGGVPMARLAAVPMLADLLAPGAIVALDDSLRDMELAAAARWTEAGLVEPYGVAIVGKGTFFGRTPGRAA